MGNKQSSFCCGGSKNVEQTNELLTEQVKMEEERATTAELNPPAAQSNNLITEATSERANTIKLTSSRSRRGFIKQGLSGGDFAALIHHWKQSLKQPDTMKSQNNLSENSDSNDSDIDFNKERDQNQKRKSTSQFKKPISIVGQQTRTFNHNRLKSKHRPNNAAQIRRSKVQKSLQFLLQLYRGRFGVVYQARRKLTRQNLSIEIIDKKKHRKGKSYLFEQLEMLQQLEHPNFSRLLSVYDNFNLYFVVTEYEEASNLQDVIASNERMQQKDVILLLRKLIENLKELRDKMLMHTCFNPETIIVVEQGGKKSASFKGIRRRRIMVKAFGYLWKINGQEPFVPPPKRSIEYESPEEIDMKPGSMSNMWNLGVMTYEMLSGTVPFKGRKQNQTKNKILNGSEVSFSGIFPCNSDTVWLNISSQAKDFLRRTLIRDPKGRMGPEEALFHDFLQQPEEET